MIDDVLLVLEDLREGNFKRNADLKHFDLAYSSLSFLGPIVDAQELYKSISGKDQDINLYENHPCIMPPWENASICYTNRYGNVSVLTLCNTKYDGELEPRWESENKIDWDNVSHILA